VRERDVLVARLHSEHNILVADDETECAASLTLPRAQ